MQPEDMFAPPVGIPAASETFVVFACAVLLCVGSVFGQRMYCVRRRAYKDSPLLPIIDPGTGQLPPIANLKHRGISVIV